LKKSQLTKSMIVPKTTKEKEFGSKLFSFYSSFTHHSTSAGEFCMLIHSVVSFMSKTFFL